MKKKVIVQKLLNELVLKLPQKWAMLNTARKWQKKPQKVEKIKTDEDISTNIKYMNVTSIVFADNSITVTLTDGTVTVYTVPAVPQAPSQTVTLTTGQTLEVIAQ